jgi:hypothetical protein
MGRRDFMPRIRGVKYFYKVYCRIYCGGRDSCPGLGGINIFIKFIVEYIAEEGVHAQD